MIALTGRLPTNTKTLIINELQLMAVRLGIEYEWLLAVMFKESGLNPLAVNSITKAKGLIQFMPATLKTLEASLRKKLPNDFLGQLPFVYEYLKPYKGKMKTYYDAYLAVFYPAAIGKRDSDILGITVSSARAKLIGSQNIGMDKNGDSMITVGEVKTWFDIGVKDLLKNILPVQVTSNPVAMVILGVLTCTALFFLIKDKFKRWFSIK